MDLERGRGSSYILYGHRAVTNGKVEKQGMGNRRMQTNKEIEIEN